MRSLLLLAQIVINSGLLFVNVYNSIVDARSWGAAIPQSLKTARQYASIYSPATFFKYFGPVHLMIAVGNIILLWNFPETRIFLISALILSLSTDLLTIKYFFPRNEVLFRTGDLGDVVTLRRTWLQWSRMNWVRSGIMPGCLLLAVYVIETVLVR